MVIYSFSNHDPQKQKLVRFILYAFCIVIGIIIFLPAIAKILTGKSMIEAFVLASSAPVISLVPVAGWLQVLTASWIIGNKVMFIFAFIPVIIYLLIAVWIFFKLHPDFFEEVLLATEMRHTAQSNAMMGKVAENTPQKIKLNKTGIHKGSGASVFFYKQILENKRSRVMLVDKNFLIYFFITLIFAFAMKKIGIVAVFTFSVYMMIFSTALSRGIKELAMHYAYLIPVKPAFKLLAIFMESILKMTVESAITFFVIGLLYKASASEIILYIFARIGFGILFLAGNILMEKVLKGSMSKVIMITLYFIILIALGLPGVLLGILLSHLLSVASAVSFIFMISFIWNIFVSVAIGYLCRDLLQYPHA
jgi:hypothetical protein